MQTFFRNLIIPLPIGLVLLTAGAAPLAATTPGVNGSVPGYDWTLRTTSTVADNGWVNVTYGTVAGSPLFVAVGVDGLSMTSPDGVSWTANTANTTHGWIGVTHNGSNQFVAVGTNTTGLFDGAMYSADGVTWTTATTPHQVGYTSVAYGNATYVAVAQTGTAAEQVMTSSNGSDWTAKTAAEAQAWKDVAYGNGVFVAVTNDVLVTNQVMRSTDNGASWTAVASPATKKGWYSVTYGNGVFVATAISGTRQRVMTSADDGQTWTLRDTPEDNNWYSVSYGNGLFVAVADSGTDRVMTSPDGITWTARPAAANQIWFGLTYGDGRFVAVSADGTGTQAMSSGGPCGDGLAYTTNQWLMVGVPCEPASNTVAGAFGNSPTANFVGGAYNDGTANGWVMYERNVLSTPSVYYKLNSDDAFNIGYGLWLKSGTAPERNRVTVTDGTPWAVSTTETGCQSANGCVVHPVETVTGDNRYNLASNPFPYPVDWSKVRVRVNGTVFTPTQAQSNGYMSKQIWIWNGANYDTCADDAPPCNLKYFQSFWVNVLPLGASQTIELLIPAEASTVSQAAPASLPWYLGWLDWVSAPARAADGDWQVRLGVENRVTGWKDTTNLLGQKTTAQTGYDAHDLIGMAPFATPYLSLVFPHLDWLATADGQKRAGDYDTDFRPAQGNPPTTWTFELRTSPTGGKVFITWQGDPAILKRSRLVDLQTGRIVEPTARAYAQGYPVVLKAGVQRYRWRYLGR